MFCVAVFFFLCIALYSAFFSLKNVCIKREYMYMGKLFMLNHIDSRLILLLTTAWYFTTHQTQLSFRKKKDH